MTNAHVTASDINSYWSTCSSTAFAQNKSHVRKKIEEGSKNSSFEAKPEDAERVAAVLAEFDFFKLM